MTVIATDGRTIAADGLHTQSDGTIVRRDAKKIVVRGGRIFAFTGLTTFFERLIHWYINGAVPEDAPKYPDGETFGFIVIEHDGTVRQIAHNSGWSSDVMPKVWSWGCERDFALGAMRAGKSAREAIEMCIEHSAWIGGEIQVVDINQTLGLPSAALAPGDYVSRIGPLTPPPPDRLMVGR